MCLIVTNISGIKTNTLNSSLKIFTVFGCLLCVSTGGWAHIRANLRVGRTTMILFLLSVCAKQRRMATQGDQIAI